MLWSAGDVKEPTRLSWRVGHEVPGVVVWPLLLKWGLGWEMLGDISYHKATLQSEGKHSFTFTFTISCRHFLDLFRSKVDERASWFTKQFCCFSFLLIGQVWYINILTWLRGSRVKIAFFKFLLSLNSKKRLKYKENNNKYRSLSWKPRSHVRILIYRTWPFTVSFKWWSCKFISFSICLPLQRKTFGTRFL